jgi:ketosteroid isomerase-like protein
MAKEDQMADVTVDPRIAVVGRLRDAMNAHDLEALVKIFDTNVVSETPAHPQRTFRGADHVRQNWEQIFRGVPDLEAELLHVVADGDSAWAEWDWHGTRPDGSPHRMRGVTIVGVNGSHVDKVRFYMEPVDADGPGPSEAVRRLIAGAATSEPTQVTVPR